jgi:N-acetylglucosamine-6-phosphate deacetylase
MFDLQINGLRQKPYCDCDFWAAPSPEAIGKLCTYLYSKNIKKILPTLITSSIESFIKNLSAIESYLNSRFSDNERQTEIAGVHIEGGLISRLGVHPEAHATEFNLKNVKELVTKFPGLIKLWTLCPLKDKHGNITRYLQDQGIKVSYGHTLASFADGAKAFEKYQVDTVTHWGNAMRVLDGINLRDLKAGELDLILNSMHAFKLEERLGLGYYALHNPKITCTFICGSTTFKDLHLAPELVEGLFKIKPLEKLIQVSDAVAVDFYSLNSLTGGTQDLGSHAENLKNLGLSTEKIRQVTYENPLKLMQIT